MGIISTRIDSPSLRTRSPNVRAATPRFSKLVEASEVINKVIKIGKIVLRVRGVLVTIAFHT